MSDCSVDTHENDKSNPIALATLYRKHDKLWQIGGARLEMWTCQRCFSTICKPVMP